MMCISLFSYGRPVVVRCMGVGLGMGWVGSWVHKFTWQWVGLGQLFGGLGWAGSMKIDPRTTLCGIQEVITFERSCTVLINQLCITNYAYV